MMRRTCNPIYYVDWQWDVCYDQEAAAATNDLRTSHHPPVRCLKVHLCVSMPRQSEHVRVVIRESGEVVPLVGAEGEDEAAGGVGESGE